MSADVSATGMDELIVARYTAGASVTRLVVDLGVARNRVHRVLKFAGVPRRREPTLLSMPQEMRDRIVRAHADGLTGPEVADLVGVDRALVYRVWQSEGLQRRQPRRGSPSKRQSEPQAQPKSQVLVEGRPPKLPEEARDAWIETQYRDGMSMRQVAARTGVSYAAVAKALKDRGVPSRPATRPQKLSSAEQIAVAVRYCEGANLETVAKEFGIAQATVLEVLRRQGQPTRTERRWSRKLTPEQEAELAAQYQAGEPVETLETRFGVNQGTVLAAVRRVGQPTRKPGKPGKEITPEQAADITSRYQAWEPVSAIALNYGIARNRVTAIATQNGAEPRKKRRAKGAVKRRGGKRDTRKADPPESPSLAQGETQGTASGLSSGSPR